MTAVVAFGGNTLLPSSGRGSMPEQRRRARVLAREIAEAARRGVSLVVTHGNGPQVGEVLVQSEIAAGSDALDLDVAGAMTQGQIGYLLQQEIANALQAAGVPVGVCTVVTQVAVAPDDPGFDDPTKPVGRFYSKLEAESQTRQHGWVMREDAGRGYRRVVPSPVPLEIVEWPAIASLIAAGFLVIACGGGGVPVVREGDHLRGVQAVIDKDFAAECLARLVGADTLVLLTEVQYVAVHYGTPAQRSLGRISVDELDSYIHQGHFPPGSMGPKVQAASRFVRNGGGRAIITSPDSLVAALQGDAGTQVIAGHRVVLGTGPGGRTL